MNTDIITLTQAAKQRISSLLEESNDSFLRIFVKSGGCSGYSYGVKVDATRYSGDREFSDETARVLIDERSWTLLKGIEIDYTESLMGGGFNISNPNAKSACGCGSSFRTDERNVAEEGCS